MTTTTTAQALTTKQPGDIVSDMIGSVSGARFFLHNIQIDPHSIGSTFRSYWVSVFILQLNEPTHTHIHSFCSHTFFPPKALIQYDEERERVHVTIGRMEEQFSVETTCILY